MNHVTKGTMTKGTVLSGTLCVPGRQFFPAHIWLSRQRGRFFPAHFGFQNAPEKTVPFIIGFQNAPEKTVPFIIDFQNAPEKTAPFVIDFQNAPEKTAPFVIDFQNAPERTVPFVTPGSPVPGCQSFSLVPGHHCQNKAYHCPPCKKSMPLHIFSPFLLCDPQSFLFGHRVCCGLPGLWSFVIGRLRRLL